MKRLLLTELERANPYVTRNIFKLPTYYNYGVGSANFGAHRELLMHEKTTQWVLNNEIANFPICIIRVLFGVLSVIHCRCGDDNYIHYWNGSKAVASFKQAREAAGYEIILVLEHFPVSSFRPWMNRHMDQCCPLLVNYVMRSALRRRA